MSHCSILETNKIIHFVSYFARVYGFEEKKREPRGGRREGRRKRRGSKIRYASVLESSVLDF